MLWLADFLQEAGAKTAHEAWRLAATQDMAAFAQGCATSGPVFSQSRLERVRTAGRNYMLAYQGLAEARAKTTARTWRVRPKFHGLDHVVLAMETDCSNPWFFACWADESLMGTFGRVVKKTHATSMRASLNRYLVSQELLWRKQ